MSALKKIIIIVLAVIALVSIVMLAKNFLPPIFPRKEVNIVYYGLWEDEKIMKPLFEEYKQKHPNVTVSYIRESPIQYRERVQNEIQNGKGPDIFRFHNTWLPMLKNDLSPIPESVMSADLFKQTFYKNSYDNLSINNSIYGLPLYFDSLALFYNEDIFQKGGLAVPATWEDLRKTAKELTVKDENGRIKIAGVALGTTNNVDHFSDILGVMFLQNGTDLLKVSSTVSSEGHNLGADTLRFYTNFTLVDKVWDETLDNSTSSFAQGKLAMYIGPSWEVFEIKKQNENLRFKVVPLPQLPGKNINWASYWVEGVSAKSKNQTEAWELLKFLSSKETLQKFYTLASQYRLFGEPYPRKDLSPVIASDPLASVFIKDGDSAKSWYLSGRTFDNGINDKMIKYLEDGVNAVLKGDEAEKALKTVEQGFSQILYQYGLIQSPLPTTSP